MCHVSVTQKIQQIRNDRSGLDMGTVIVPNRKNNLLRQRSSRDTPRGDMQREGNTTFPTQPCPGTQQARDQRPTLFSQQTSDFLSNFILLTDPVHDTWSPCWILGCFQWLYNPITNITIILGDLQQTLLKVVSPAIKGL